jgi:Lrp/AsnC family transcriptional regulator, regulator for asnA, asnC and gidA
MIDETDSQIVSILSSDARVPFSRIAKKLGISTDTVTRRYNRLRAEKIILRPSITISANKIGYDGYAIFFLKIASSRNPDPQEQLSKVKNTVTLSKSMGDHDLVALCLFSTSEDLKQLTNELAEIPGIIDMEVNILLSQMQITIPENIIQYFAMPKRDEE